MTLRKSAAVAVIILLSARSGNFSASTPHAPQATARRQLGEKCQDSVLDMVKYNKREDDAEKVRKEAAKREKDGAKDVCQANNGDTNTAVKFHKSLPHDQYGQVDEDAFAALEECVETGDYDTCEDVPSGDPSGFLVNPIAGLSVDMAGPVSSSAMLPPAPLLDSAELAAQLAECYWMALARDVPFSNYGSDPITTAAAANLADMPGFSEMFGVSMNADGSVDAASQLFRASFWGVEEGPMISQLMLKDYTLDSTTVTPKINTFAPGKDYMTSYEDWLYIQNGGAPDGNEELDSVPRFIRNARDLSKLVATDITYTEALRGVLILFAEGALSQPGFMGPYDGSSRQKGFVNFGASHVLRLLGTSELAIRSAWYQKWNVHLVARPEALAGSVHNTLTGAISVPIHDSLMTNTDLLNRVKAANADQNSDGEETYLLSQAINEGSPTHPSYPAGHAVQSGAYATIIKAFVGHTQGEECFSDPVYADEDGLGLSSYTGDCLTYSGEINKLATNVALGRSMCGVHYRFDSTEGLILGETVAVRLLHQELMSFPEQCPMEFRLFTGEVLELNADGSFSIDGETCDAEVYQGVDSCFEK